MKFSVLQQDLLPVLQAVSRSIGVKATLPVLSNVMLSLEKGKLRVAATNLEIGVIKYLSVEQEEEGQVTVPARTIDEILASLPASKVEIQSQGEVLVIKSGKFKASINGISSSEFPAIPMPNGEGVTFNKEILLSSGQILFAAASDEGRPVLTGILTEAKNELLELVATDGFRLAHRQIKLPASASLKTLIPKKTFEEVIRVLGEEEAETVGISTSQDQNQVVFTIGSTTVSSRLIEGQFPNWEKIVPKTFVGRAVVEKETLLKAVKLAAIFAKNESNIVTMKVGDGKLTLTSEARELGNQENEVDAQIEGEPLQIAFNAKFLQDAISASSSSQLMIEFSGPLSPALIKPMGVEGLEYIIMPVRLS
jgi:DNA polymerase III subunit beta